MRSTCAFLLCSFLLLHSSSEALAQQHLLVANSFIGHTEHGNNRSAHIDRWNHAVSAPLGSPWCASFVSFCLAQGRVKAPKTRSAWSRAFVLRGSIPASRVLTGEYKVRQGDIIIWRRSATQGHIGFAKEDWRAAKGATIEGNTSSGLKGSQWNGNGVFVRTRSISPFNHFRITHITPVSY